MGKEIWDQYKFNIDGDNDLVVVFKGTLLGEVHRKARWKAGKHKPLSLYRTPSWNFVCIRGDDEVYVCKTVEEAYKFFGAGTMARRLYKDIEKRER